jgi:hypothetical protein
VGEQNDSDEEVNAYFTQYSEHEQNQSDTGVESISISETSV